MLKILQARFWQYVNWKIPDVQAGFRKGKSTRGQTANIRWIIEKAREFQINIYFCFIDYTKAFDYVDHNKLWEITRDGNPRSPLVSWETCVWVKKQVRTLHGTTWQFDWLKIGKEVQGCILSPCLLNSYAEYIMQNARLDKSQAGIKTARRNINNLRYADDTTLMAESEEQLESLLMMVKEEWKSWLKLNIQKI